MWFNLQEIMNNYRELMSKSVPEADPDYYKIVRMMRQAIYDVQTGQASQMALWHPDGAFQPRMIP